MKVLITGFDPFGGEKINPAWEAVKRLPETIGGAEIVRREIPTVFGGSLELLDREIREHEAGDTHKCRTGGREKLRHSGTHCD